MKHPLRRFCGATACAGVLLFGSTHLGFAADPSQEAVVQKGSEEWNDMRRKNPSQRLDLSGASLKGKRLRKVDFSQTGLAGADMRQSDFGGSEFRDADLRGAKLDGSILVGGRFTGANLNQASLAGVSCSGADFSGAKMATTVLRRADCGEAKLRGADLAGTDLREANLEHADLSRSDLRAANLWLARTGGADFSGALISNETVLSNGKTGSAEWAAEHGAMFVPVAAAPESSHGMTGDESPRSGQPAPLSSSSATAPKNSPQLAKTLKPARAWRPAPSTISYDADQLEQIKSNVMKWNRQRAANPSMKVSLKEAPLANRVLAYADFHGADLEKAVLKNADLEKAVLSKANLGGADLRSANLQRADFRQADLRGANLWLANTGRATFDGAIVSSGTVLDTGKNATPEWARKHAARFSDETGR